MVIFPDHALAQLVLKKRNTPDDPLLTSVAKDDKL
jgi:hypothetical protein